MSMQPSPETSGADRFESLVSPQVLDLKPYVPGKPIEELRRERGLERIVKLASNENPAGPSPSAIVAFETAAKSLNRYPDGYGFQLKEALAQRWQVSRHNLVLGNGSSEIIEMLVRLLVRPGKAVVLASPSFSMYEITARAQGGPVRRVPLHNHVVDLEGIRRAVNRETGLVILGNPNNPTGTIFGRAQWERFLAETPREVGILLDEAYAEYAENAAFPQGRDYLDEDRPLVVARTFSKAYGLASVRLGYALAPRGLVDLMNRLRLPFNANGPAQAAAAAALGDEAHVRRARELNRVGRERLTRFLRDRGADVVPSEANFVLARVGDGERWFDALLGHGVIVRAAGSFGLPEWIRVTVGLPEELAWFEHAFDRVADALGGPK